MQFFLTGVTQTAMEATDAARKLWELFDQDRHEIQKQARLQVLCCTYATAAKTAYHLHCDSLQGAEFEIHPAVHKSLRRLKDMNIVKKITGRQRNCLFLYKFYMNILNKGLAIPGLEKNPYIKLELVESM